MDGRPAISRAALVADDDEFFRMALRVVLTSRLGFEEVIEVANLDDAVEHLAEQGAVDLALFDLAMPGMESPASLRAVRECNPDLRIAVVSASQERNDMLLALASGVHGYVTKGAGAAAIEQALRLILDGLVYVPPSITELDGEEAPLRPAVPRSAARALTPRQRDVLRLLVDGRSNKEIARALDLGEGTVKVHMSALFRTLGASTRSAAAVSGAGLLAKLGS